MPTSHPFQLNEITHLVTLLKPKRVLEIGIGFGKYGMLLREYLEIWGEGDDYAKWTRTIDGIEIFEPYILPHHRSIYDQIFIGNAIDILPEIDNYDLILLIDVLEHFEMEDAKRLLALCKTKSEHIIISSPKDIGTQGAGYNNEFEAHRSQWTSISLKKELDSQLLFIPNRYSIIALYAPKAKLKRIKKALLTFGISSLIKKYAFWLYQLIERANLPFLPTKKP